MKVLLPVVIAISIGYIALIDTAAVRSEEFSEHLQRIVHDGEYKNIRTERAIESANESSPRRTCLNSIPCGWAVYVPFKRRVQYFMKNTCECPDSSYKCVRADDDLSVSAYVYRCRQNITVHDIVESTEDVD